MAGFSPQQAPLQLDLEQLIGRQQDEVRQEATPVATQPITKDFPSLPKTFFCRPAEVVAPELIGCRLVKRQADGSLLWGVVVEGALGD